MSTGLESRAIQLVHDAIVYGQGLGNNHHDDRTNEWVNRQISDLEQKHRDTISTIEQKHRNEISILQAELIQSLKQQQQTIITPSKSSYIPQLNAAQIGNINEEGVQIMLETRLGNLFDVKNVSKIGQGHQGDLLITTDDNIRIMIDPKIRKPRTGINGNTLRTILDRKEVDKFNVAIDHSLPDGAIIYCTIPVTPDDNTDMFTRNKTFVQYIYPQDECRLVNTIINMIVHVRIQRQIEKNDQNSKQIQTELDTARNVALSDVQNQLVEQCKFLRDTLLNCLKQLDGFQKQWPSRHNTIKDLLTRTHSVASQVIKTDLIAQWQEVAIPVKRGGRSNPTKTIKKQLQDTSPPATKKRKRVQEKTSNIR